MDTDAVFIKDANGTRALGFITPKGQRTPRWLVLVFDNGEQITHELSGGSRRVAAKLRQVLSEALQEG